MRLRQPPTLPPASSTVEPSRESGDDLLVRIDNSGVGLSTRFEEWSISFWRKTVKNRAWAAVAWHFAPRYVAVCPPGLIPCQLSHQAAHLWGCAGRFTSARAIVTTLAVMIPHPTQRPILSSP